MTEQELTAAKAPADFDVATLPHLLLMDGVAAVLCR
jgi:hypothetical protein